MILHNHVQFLVFSSNFSSAGKGPFMTSKAKNMPQRCTLNFLRGAGYRVKGGVVVE